jgi:hypothetical protein
MNWAWIVLVFIKIYVYCIKSDIYIIKFLPKLFDISVRTYLGGVALFFPFQWIYTAKLVHSYIKHLEALCKLRFWWNS